MLGVRCNWSNDSLRNDFYEIHGAGNKLLPLKFTAMLKQFSHCRLWLSAGVLYLLFILIVSLVPLTNLPPASFQGIDKLEHFAAYFVAAGYFCLLIHPRYFVQLLLFLIFFGAFIEGLQSLTSYRFFEVWDIVANTLGVLTGYWVMRKRHTTLEKCL